jgi:hypothetical protein
MSTADWNLAAGKAPTTKPVPLDNHSKPIEFLWALFFIIILNIYSQAPAKFETACGRYIFSLRVEKRNKRLALPYHTVLGGLSVACSHDEISPITIPAWIRTILGTRECGFLLSR